MDKKLYEALVYAYELLKEQAETGHYPVSALAENGGKGYEPITKILKACEGEYLNENSGLNLQNVIVSLPDIDSVSSHAYSKAYNCEFKRRHVLKSTTLDHYHTGFMDCYDWLKGNER